METKEITGSIQIRASKKRVWDILLKEEYNRQWYAEFGEGTKAETDWREGSHAFFTNAEECGLIARVAVNNPETELLLSYEGLILYGKADYTSPAALQVAHGYERYTLSEEDGTTILHTAALMSMEMYNMMKNAWERALNKIKELAENP